MGETNDKITQVKPKAKAPDIQEILKNADIFSILELSAPEATNPARYFWWDELQYRPSPRGLNSKTWWAGIKLHRMLGRQPIPLTNNKGIPFSFSLLPQIHALLHELDNLFGVMPHAAGGKKKSTSYANAIMDESIMSSVLEGAIVTRAEAREMLRQNRSPLNDHERMVRNNYRTMKYLLAQRDKDLTPDTILDLHRQMTEDTLDDPAKCGCLRSAEDNVRVENVVTAEIIHVPPPAEMLPERLRLMCDFANGAGGYIHPVLRAVMLHFWLAFDHPFVDGNGRTARSLFYWAMLRGGYDLIEYISISQEIDLHPKRYYLSFQQTEEDDGDLNYFIFNQLHTILDAVRKLKWSADEAESVLYAGEDVPEDDLALNPRQKAFMQQIRQLPPKASFSITAYCDQFKVVRQTARTDLAALVHVGILSCRKQGKTFLYSLSPSAQGN